MQSNNDRKYDIGFVSLGIPRPTYCNRVMSESNLIMGQDGEKLNPSPQKHKEW